MMTPEHAEGPIFKREYFQLCSHPWCPLRGEDGFKVNVKRPKCGDLGFKLCNQKIGSLTTRLEDTQRIRD